MPSLFETLTQSLGPNALGQLSQQVGADHPVADRDVVELHSQAHG